MKHLSILPLFMAFFAKIAMADVQILTMHSETEIGTMHVAATIDPKKSIVHYKSSGSDRLYQYINQEDVMSIRAEGEDYELVSRQRPDLTVLVEEHPNYQMMELRSLNSYFKKGDSSEAFLSDILIRLQESSTKALTGTVSFYYEGEYKTYPLVSVVSQ